MASTRIPFTSESKDAIADVPEILAEVELGLKEIARKLRRYMTRQSALSERREKEEIIRKILPRIARKLSDILHQDEPDIAPVVAKIMGNISIRRIIEKENGLTVVRLSVENHGEAARTFKLHDVIPQEASDVSPAAKAIPIGNGYDYNWKLSLAPGEATSMSYKVRSEGHIVSEPVVEGLDAEVVTGARVI